MPEFKGITTRKDPFEIRATSDDSSTVLLNFKDSSGNVVAYIDRTGVLSSTGLTTGIPVFNVKTYGAVGNGVTDDWGGIWSAILAANSAGGGVVYFPLATYLTSDHWEIPSNIYLVGPRGTTIKAKAGTTFNGHLGLVTFANVTNVGISGVSLDCNSQVCNALAINGTKDVLIENCVIKNSGHTGANGMIPIIGPEGFWASTSTERVLFRNVEIGPSLNHGVCFQGGQTDEVVVIRDVRFENCYIHDNNLSGISNFVSVKRAIKTIRVHSCHFETNGKLGSGPQEAHINDSSKTGWVDLDVGHCYFGLASQSCGGVSDHKGRDIRIHHNHFNMGCLSPGGFEIWWIALGDDRTFANTDRTWHAKVDHNFVQNCGAADFDSCRYVQFDHNTYYRNKGRPLGLFGHHHHTRFEHETFIENGQSPGSANNYEKAGISCGRGVIVRDCVFRDDQGTPTQTYGIIGEAGDPDEGQPVAIIEGNDFTNTPTPISFVYPVRVRRNYRATQASVASGATVTLPLDAEDIDITGTSNITSITADREGVVRLRFTGTASGTGLTDGSNLKIAGNFVYTPDDTITLRCDGTNWIELGRSVN